MVGRAASSWRHLTVLLTPPVRFPQSGIADNIPAPGGDAPAPAHAAAGERGSGVGDERGRRCETTTREREGGAQDEMRDHLAWVWTDGRGERVVLARVRRGRRRGRSVPAARTRWGVHAFRLDLPGHDFGSGRSRCVVRRGREPAGTGAPERQAGEREVPLCFHIPRRVGDETLEGGPNVASARPEDGLRRVQRPPVRFRRRARAPRFRLPLSPGVVAGSLFSRAARRMDREWGAPSRSPRSRATRASISEPEARSPRASRSGRALEMTLTAS
jgi:hypothetical protein